jgi:site-specific DNA recombinase
MKYRYYLSSALIQGTAASAGSLRRVPATDIEALVIKSVREHFKPSQPIDDRSLIHTRVARVEVQPKQLVIRLAEEPKATANRVLLPLSDIDGAQRASILYEARVSRRRLRPMRTAAQFKSRSISNIGCLSKSKSLPASSQAKSRLRTNWRRQWAKAASGT